MITRRNKQIHITLWLHIHAYRHCFDNPFLYVYFPIELIIIVFCTKNSTEYKCAGRLKCI